MRITKMLIILINHLPVIDILAWTVQNRTVEYFWLHFAQEESKNWVTKENLEEKIAYCLEHETNYNFALSPSEEKHYVVSPAGCVDTEENAPGPAAYVTSGSRPVQLWATITTAWWMENTTSIAIWFIVASPAIQAGAEVQVADTSLQCYTHFIISTVMNWAPGRFYSWYLNDKIKPEEMAFQRFS